MEKISFNATLGRAAAPYEISRDPSKWSYIHHFRVHFTTARVQLIANRIDVTLASESPAPPSDVEVAQTADPQIKQQLAAGAMWWGLRSFNITNIEYKETIAMRKTDSGW